MNALVWIVTPAYRRYGLSSICFAQHAYALDKLHGGRSSSTQCVVVTDDYNRYLAQEHMFEVILRDNDRLGRRFNDGIEEACHLGATHVVPVGSDSFVDLSFLDGELPQDRIVISQNYAVVRNDGKERCHLQMNATTYALPISMLEAVDFRPCAEDINRGCDTSILDNTLAANKDHSLVEFRESHPLETVAFQTRGRQISDYDSYYEMWGIEKTADPFGALYDVYPRQLVDAVRDIYSDMEAACT